MWIFSYPSKWCHFWFLCVSEFSANKQQKDISDIYFISFSENLTILTKKDPFIFFIKTHTVTFLSVNCLQICR